MPLNYRDRLRVGGAHRVESDPGDLLYQCLGADHQDRRTRGYLFRE